MSYEVQHPTLFPSITVERLKKELPADQLEKLMQHALAFACLDGNAFPDLIEQYLPEAYDNVWSNGWAVREPKNDYTGGVHDFLLLYPMTNGEHWAECRRKNMVRLGIDPEDPKADSKYYDAWFREEAEKNPPHWQGLALIDEDGNPTPLVAANAQHFDLVVAEVQKIDDKFTSSTVEALNVFDW